MREGANAQREQLRSFAHHNQQWLVEGPLPLGAVEVGWNNDDRIAFSFDLLELGFKSHTQPINGPFGEVSG